MGAICLYVHVISDHVESSNKCFVPNAEVKAVSIKIYTA